MMHAIITVAVFAVCGLCNAAVPANIYVPQSRAVSNPTTPNQILDAIFERTLTKLQGLGWDKFKRVQNGQSEFPFTVNTDAQSGETFNIRSAGITGFGTLRRSKSGSFNTDESILKGTAVVEDVRASADYTVTFPGVGEAPPQTVDGQVTEKVNKLFADIEINMLNGVPQSIRSYSVRSGQDNLEQATNLDGNSMAPLHSNGFRKSLRELIESTMNKNIKVQINKSIQDMKNGL